MLRRHKQKEGYTQVPGGVPPNSSDPFAYESSADVVDPSSRPDSDHESLLDKFYIPWGSELRSEFFRFLINLSWLIPLTWFLPSRLKKISAYMKGAFFKEDISGKSIHWSSQLLGWSLVVMNGFSCGGAILCQFVALALLLTGAVSLMALSGWVVLLAAAGMLALCVMTTNVRMNWKRIPSFFASVARNFNTIWDYWNTYDRGENPKMVLLKKALFVIGSILTLGGVIKVVRMWENWKPGVEVEGLPVVKTPLDTKRKFLLVLSLIGSMGAGFTIGMLNATLISTALSATGALAFLGLSATVWPLVIALVLGITAGLITYYMCFAEISKAIKPEKLHKNVSDKVLSRSFWADASEIIQVCVNFLNMKQRIKDPKTGLYLRNANGDYCYESIQKVYNVEKQAMEDKEVSLPRKVLFWVSCLLMISLVGIGLYFMLNGASEGIRSFFMSADFGEVFSKWGALVIGLGCTLVAMLPFAIITTVKTIQTLCKPDAFDKPMGAVLWNLLLFPLRLLASPFVLMRLVNAFGNGLLSLNGYIKMDFIGWMTNPVAYMSTVGGAGLSYCSTHPEGMDANEYNIKQFVSDNKAMETKDVSEIKKAYLHAHPIKPTRDFTLGMWIGCFGCWLVDTLFGTKWSQSYTKAAVQISEAKLIPLDIALLNYDRQRQREEQGKSPKVGSSPYIRVSQEDPHAPTPSMTEQHPSRVQDDAGQRGFSKSSQTGFYRLFVTPRVQYRPSSFDVSITPENSVHSRPGSMRGSGTDL